MDRQLLDLAGGSFTFGDGFAQPNALAVMPNGDLIAGGFFDAVGGVFAINIARWDGATWSAMANGVGDPSTFDTIIDMTVSPSGDLFVVGQFATSYDGAFLSNVAMWDGTAWVGLGAGVDGTLFSVAALSNGNIVVSGSLSQSVAMWDGASWTGVGPVIEGGVSSVAATPSGNIVIGGDFAYVGGRPSANFAVFGCSNSPCDADVNQDGNSDQGDVDYLINVVAGGPNDTGIDPDFNQDGNTDQGDVDALLNVVAGGACP